MNSFIDSILSMILNNLSYLHLLIISLIITKALHFQTHKRQYWKLYQWVYFDTVELRHSNSRKSLASKKIQNKMTRLIFVLAIIDVLFSIFQLLIGSNANQ